MQGFAAQRGKGRVAPMARIGQVDMQLGCYARGSRTEDDDSLGEEERLLDVMGDEQCGEAIALPEVHEFALHGKTRE